MTTHGPQGHDHAGHDHSAHDHSAHGHSNHDHGHGGHHHHVPTDFGTAFALGAALNTGFVVAEFGFGYVANSVALMADATHNLADVLALLLSWGAAVLGKRVPSQRRTYGWGRTTILAALINAAVLLASVGAIAVEAIRRFAHPLPVENTTVMWVAAVGIAVNGATALLFLRGQSDLNVKAAFQHMMADAVVSAGVVVSAFVIGMTGLSWIDPMTSLVIVAVIVAGTWGVFRQAANLSIDGVPDGIAHADVMACLRKLPGVTEVHDLHVWGLSTTQTALTAHLVRHTQRENRPGAQVAFDHELLEAANSALNDRFGISHVTLQLETPELAELCKLRPDHVV